MDLIITGVVAGVLGTLVMDSLNYLFARIGILTKIDIGIIGRMSAGWIRGHFRYHDPDEIEQVTHDVVLGYLTHYVIGIVLAVVYVLGWDLLVGGPTSSIWALTYGVATSVASYFIVFPSMGFGVFGRRSPEGFKNSLSPLANHLFFGIGMAVAIAIA